MFNGVRASRLEFACQLLDCVLSGDVVCVFSNGGFGNIRAKLLERLKGTR